MKMDTTVFVSGSRHISQINDIIRERLQTIIHKNFSVIVGDAAGADRTLQSYFAERSYPHVTIYCSGEHCRNNVGNWPIHHVDVSSKLKGRAFYTEKDKTMAAKANYGLVLWDGKSSGSLRNILELIQQEKPVRVYFWPQQRFYCIKSKADAKGLIDQCNSQDIKTWFSKPDIFQLIEESYSPLKQPALAL